jgi:PEGA domain
MTRALHISSLVVLLTLGFSGAASAARPKIAILGLEAAPGPTGAVDPATTLAARDVTIELRQRAQSGTSPYTLAPNSAKELSDEKLLMSCDNEKADCMAVIGAGLAADVLLYGRIEKKGDVYRVSLKLLDVRLKTVEAASDELPVGAAPSSVAKRLYSKMIGDRPGGSGSLIVRATTESGGELRGAKVIVDEEPKGELVGGKLTVTGIAEGRHTVAIEAPGFRRFEEIITVHGGEQVPVNARLLDKAPIQGSPPAAPRERSSAWKYVFWTSVAVGIVGGGFSGYAYYQQGQLVDEVVPMSGAAIGPSDCSDRGPAKSRLPDPGKLKLDELCTWHNRHVYSGWGTGIVAGSAAILSGYMWYRNTRQPRGERTARVGRGRPEVAIVPVVSLDGGGAALSMTW